MLASKAGSGAYLEKFIYTVRLHWRKPFFPSETVFTWRYLPVWRLKLRSWCLDPI